MCLADAPQAEQFPTDILQPLMYGRIGKKRFHLLVKISFGEQDRQIVEDMGCQFRNEVLKVFRSDLFEKPALLKPLFYPVTGFDQGIRTPFGISDIDDEPILDRMVPENVSRIPDQGIFPGEIPGNIRININLIQRGHQKSHYDNP